MEIYTAVYNHKGEELKPAEALVLEENSFEDFHPDKTLCFFGDGAKKCMGKLSRKNICSLGAFAQGKRNATPGSEAPLGRFEETAYFEPNYLKDFQATVPKKLDRLIGKIDSFS